GRMRQTIANRRCFCPNKTGYFERGHARAMLDTVLASYVLFKFRRESFVLTEYRREYTEFNESITREHYLHYSGQKVEYELERIYDRHSDLFTRQAIAELQREHDRISPEFESDKRALAHLLSFAKENYLEAQTKQLTSEIAEYEATSYIDWDGQRVGF